MTTIGVVSPGAMGSALGRAWAAGGARVVVTIAGRSARTRTLAEGLEALPSLVDVVAAADIVVSVGPPAAAVAIATAVVEAAHDSHSTPLFADLNAISPALVDTIGTAASEAGLAFVDGSISGGPPRPGGDTTLYLSGVRAAELADLDAGGLRRLLVGDRPGRASAVKMCTASVYKGTAAVWAQALETAYRLGVLDVVLDDLAGEFPDQVATASTRLALAASKSDRFVAEMEQIARTQESAGTSPELFEGMATVYRRLSRTPLAALSPEEAADLNELTRVLDRLR